MAVLSLALGIGANTVVFSVINALVLKPLPVHQPERLFFLESDSGPSESFPHYRDLRDRNRTFAGLAGYRITPISLDDWRTPARIWGYLSRPATISTSSASSRRSAASSISRTISAPARRRSPC